VKKFVEKKKLEMQRILFFFVDEISPSLGKTCNLRKNKLLDRNGSMDTVSTKLGIFLHRKWRRYNKIRINGVNE
jgi:hypothetical protein